MGSVLSGRVPQDVFQTPCGFMLRAWEQDPFELLTLAGWESSFYFQYSTRPFFLKSGENAGSCPKFLLHLSIGSFPFHQSVHHRDPSPTSSRSCVPVAHLVTTLPLQTAAGFRLQGLVGKLPCPLACFPVAAAVCSAGALGALKGGCLPAGCAAPAWPQRGCRGGFHTQTAVEGPGGTLVTSASVCECEVIDCWAVVGRPEVTALLWKCRPWPRGQLVPLSRHSQLQSSDSWSQVHEDFCSALSPGRNIAV